MLSSPGALTEVDIPKLPLYLAFGVIFGVAPMLPNRYNRDLVYLVSTIYKRSARSACWAFLLHARDGEDDDTYTAYHGRSITPTPRKNEPPPQFPRAARSRRPSSHRDAARRGPRRVPAA